MSRFHPRFALLTALAVALASQTAFAQGVLVNINPDEGVALPRPNYIIIRPPHPIPPSHPAPVPPPQTYKIKELSVQTKIVDQVAKVQVSQSFVNTGSRDMEVCFVFPLPYDGAVDQLTLLVDGKEFTAKLLDAKEARTMYEEIVRKNKDPALLEWMGTGLFKTSVFPVPAGAERKVTLRYSQLCRKLDGVTDFIFPLSTAKYTSAPVEQVSLQLSIESDAEIKNIYSPSHSIEIKRPDEKHATISYTGKNEIPSADFRLFYDVGKGHVGTSVLSYRPNDKEDGYFMMLTSPQIKANDAEQSKKTVVFVLDRSGSMQGKKIEQAKAALKFVINNLKENDSFNIVAFDSDIESFQPELQRFNDETRKKALGFVEGLYPGGGTNIDGAMKTALAQIKDPSRPNYILFLTDGIPTAGETNEAKIVANAKEKNSHKARFLTFGVGYDLNSRLLDKLVRENFGLSEFVRPNEDIEARVSALYNRIGSPVLTDVAIKFDVEGLKTEDGSAVNRAYPKDVHDLFAGEQVVIVGRYKKPGDGKITISGKVGDKEQKFDFPGKFVEKSNDDSYAFIEKLWAMRRVGEIIDQIDLKGKNDELVKELVTLATKHGILTPYTSFLADDRTNLRDTTANTTRALEGLNKDLSKSDGKEGVAQRGLKSALQRAGDSAAPSENFGYSAGGGGRGEAVKAAAAPAATGAVPGGPMVPTPPPVSGAATYLDTEDKVVVANNVRQVGNRTFYRRGENWVDSKVSEAQEKNVVKVERFSKEYFELAKKYGKEVTQYMALDEPVTIELGGQAYSF